MIGIPPLATDLIGPATQASSSDMIVAALGFPTCTPFARAIDQIDYTKPILSTPICTFIPPVAYASGDIPKWTYGLVQTLVNQPGPQSKLYLKKGLQYGTNVRDMLWVFSEGAWETLLATVKIMNAIPYSKLTPARISRGFQGLPRPDHPRPAECRLRQGVEGRAFCMRQPDELLQLHGQRQVEDRRDLAEAARSEVDTRHGRTAGPAAAGPTVARDAEPDAGRPPLRRARARCRRTHRERRARRRPDLPRLRDHQPRHRRDRDARRLPLLGVQDRVLPLPPLVGAGLRAHARLHGRVRRPDRAGDLSPASEHGAARQAGRVARPPARPGDR